MLSLNRWVLEVDVNVNMFAQQIEIFTGKLICTKANSFIEPPAELLPLAFKNLAPPQKNYRLQRAAPAKWELALTRMALSRMPALPRTVWVSTDWLPGEMRCVIRKLTASLRGSWKSRSVSWWHAVLWMRTSVKPFISNDPAATSGTVQGGWYALAAW